MSYLSEQQYKVTAVGAATATLQPQTPGTGSNANVPSQIVITWPVARPTEFIVGALFPLVKILASV